MYISIPTYRSAMWLFCIYDLPTNPKEVSTPKWPQHFCDCVNALLGLEVLTIAGTWSLGNIVMCFPHVHVTWGRTWIIALQSFLKQSNHWEWNLSGDRACGLNWSWDVLSPIWPKSGGDFTEFHAWKPVEPVLWKDLEIRRNVDIGIFI